MDKGTCAGTCGRELVDRAGWFAIPPDDPRKVDQKVARLHGRGLCARCHRHATKDGTVLDYPSQHVTRDMVVDEWQRQADPTRSRRHNILALAPRIGMSVGALEKAIDRAVKRGEIAA